jgi:peptide/nickel transport system substrate-binding protein
MKTLLALALLLALASPARAQKAGGVMHVYLFDSPATMSIHEEVTIATLASMMGVFNNLVTFDPKNPRTSLETIVPDLATSWTWDATNTRLTFQLRQGVQWHDGKPFTARDVKCTWDMLLGTSDQKLRINPRKAWYRNLDSVTVDNDYQATFVLKRPQPSLPVLLAAGVSPVYPCHITAAQMRQNPIGTGPFKFVEFKRNELIRVVRNPNYWKAGRPYLDGIDWEIMKNQSTGSLAFIAGKVDMTSPYYFQPPILHETQAQAPKAICALVPANNQRNVIINRSAPPFDNPDLRRAVALTIDRKAFIDTLTQGEADIGGALLAPPAGIWGMPVEMTRALPGYDPDVAKNRAEARAIMERLGYGPSKHLSVKVSARDNAAYRQPAVLLIDQLKEIYIDAELEPIDSAMWYAKVTRKDYTIGLNLTGNGVDDPDQAFYENYACGSESNYDGYCNPEIDALIDAQSRELDPTKRRELVWRIETRLAQDVARPVLFHSKSGTCWQPYVKGFSEITNSEYNGFRMEDVWLDR